MKRSREKQPAKEEKQSGEGSLEKRSIKETTMLYGRALKLVWQYTPQYIVSMILHGLLQAASPYVILYFSARFLEELSGSRRSEVLVQWVFLVLVLSLLFSLCERMAFRWKRREDTCFLQLYSHRGIYSDKLLGMDFEKMDDPGTLDRLTQIEQDYQFMGFGMGIFVWHMKELLNAFFQVAGGVILSWTLFALPVAEQYRQSRGLNAVFAGVWFVVMLTVFMRLLFSKAEREDSIQYNDHGAAANRMFGWYGFRLFDRTERAAEMRMYRQDLFGQDMMLEFDSVVIGQSEHFHRKLIGRCKMGNAVLSGMMLGAVYLYVCLKAWFGAFGVGSVTRYVGAVTSLAGGVASILNVWSEAKINAPYLRKEFDFLDIPNEMYQGTLTIEKRKDRDYEVEFRDVSFQYPNASEYALRHVNMKFRVGERLAVVGENGSGKTTFIKLLCRLYDPTEGQILLNGIDIRKYDYQEYLSIFAAVFQDFQLLAVALGQNVAAGSLVDAGRARECLKKAGLSEWLEKQRSGLETRLYKKVFVEEGVEISGGEEQKIALARCMYRNAPFIILDEPTAALDPVSEYEVYTHFNDIITDCTAIYISHRLSSCRFCDEIAVFHQGNVVEQGTHENLLDKGGKYSELWKAQAQYYV